MIRKALLLILPLLLVFTTAYADFVEGKDYARIMQPVTTSDPDKVVVTELFWYGCPHCFRFEPYINKWKQHLPEGVKFEQVPSVLNPSWVEHARAYYALQMMGELDKVHEPLFKAIHLERKRLNSLDTLAKFVAGQGVDEKKFRDLYHSFPVDTLVRKGKQKERKYGHDGVPVVIINGKYRASASMTGSNARLIDVMNFLINKELAEKTQ
jgi:thiol:disulfide interchange protein DsbA